MNPHQTMKLKLTDDLAELAGIHAGDGYLRYNGSRKELDISGSIEEKNYYDCHVIPLFEKVFKVSIQGKYFPSRKTYGFVNRNRYILEIFRDLGFPSGKKSTIVEIPKQILKSKNTKLITSFLRGYFDTDGCLTFRNKPNNTSIFKKKHHFYPKIQFTTCSKKMATSVLSCLFNLKISANLYRHDSKKLTENPKYIVESLGFTNLVRFMKLIGTKNSTKFSRYQIWKKYGFCPTKTTYGERIAILNSKIDINSFYDKDL